ncbi:MAG: sulfotransferase domain-containing protein [Candidatus Binataceae bacterium]
MSSGSKARLPDFIAVGPPRTATTWLDRVLSGRVGLPREVKETHFFSWHYSKGLDWYLDHFRECPAHLPIGEVCASYFDSVHARHRIAQHIPRCKIICTLRDPVQWLYSFYRLQRRVGRVAVGFEAALVKHFDLMFSRTRFAFLTAGWQQSFGRDNVLVLLLDDLVNDRQACLDRLCNFIGISRIAVDPSAAVGDGANLITHAPRSRRLAHNASHLMDWMREHRMYGTIERLERAGVWRYCLEGGEKFEPIDPALEARLRELLRPEVYALECILERDLSAWKNPPPGQVAPREAQDGSRDWQLPRR